MRPSTERSVSDIFPDLGLLSQSRVQSVSQSIPEQIESHHEKSEKYSRKSLNPPGITYVVESEVKLQAHVATVWSPNPRKLMPASIRTEAAICRVVKTINT